MPKRISLYINDRNLLDEIEREWERKQMENLKKRKQVSMNEIIIELLRIGIKAKRMGVH